MQLKDILARLQGVKGSGNQYTARCPAHDDKHNSLSVSLGNDGRILTHCHAGCTTEETTAAMGLTMKDLFLDKPKEPQKIAATYDYTDAGGKLLYQKVRYEQKTFAQRHPDGKGGWAWGRGKGVSPVLFNLPKLRASDRVYIVEGEKDCLTLQELGRTATTSSDGAAAKWLPSYTEALAGKTVFILPDNDKPGQDYALTIANALAGVANVVKIFNLAELWPEIPEHGDVTDYFKWFAAEQPEAGRAGALASLEAMIELSPAYKPLSTDEEWEQPIPFDSFEVDAGDFPIESLPAVLRDFVSALSVSTQTPLEMGGLMSLGILSACVLEHCEVAVTSDWKEPLCLFVVSIAEPGERKTAVQSSSAKPLHKYESNRNEREREEVAKNRSERKMLEKELQEMENKCAKGKSGVTRGDVAELAAELARFEDVFPFQLLADDCTPEKLANMMSQQGGRMTVLSAEGGVFDAMSGRYDKSVNLDVYLKGHACEPLRVDRIGRSSDKMNKPRLTMVLAVQPEVISGLMGNSAFRGRGLCARFLYVRCNSKIGYREITPAPIPDHVKEAYEDFIEQLLDTDTSGVLTLGDDAQNARIAYSYVIEKRLGNEWEFMRDWGAKLVGAAVRIAGLLHIAKRCSGNPFDAPIAGETMQEAVNIAEYLSKHAESVFLQMGADESLADAEYLLKRIAEIGDNVTTRRDLHQQCRGKFKKSEDIKEPLSILEDRGFIRITERQTGKRPSIIIEVNPFVFQT